MSETKEIIVQRMLSNIDNSYDKTEGSFFYDATMPVAIELENMSILADSILNKGFADTATGSDLDKIVAEQGIVRKAATQSFGQVTITGVVGSTITKGELVASDNVNFVFQGTTIIPSGGSITVNVTCESYGTIGNVPTGAIKYFPKTLEGLQTVINTAAITNGYDVETDESLRERYYTKIQTPATSGNKYEYLNWAKEVTGVGDARIQPLWNGNGTVKVIIINSNKRAADTTLINAVSTHIEEVRPIGATVTTVSATEKPISITMGLTIDTNNYNLATIKTNIETSITNYIKSIAFQQNYVSYAKIGSLILSVNGVIDYSNLKVNAATINVSILDTEVAVFGGVTIG